MLTLPFSLNISEKARESKAFYSFSADNDNKRRLPGGSLRCRKTKEPSLCLFKTVFAHFCLVYRTISVYSLANILKSAGTSLGKQTVINYVSYMTDSYLLFPITNYAAKLVDKETSPKYYFMDTGLLGLQLLDCRAAQLENLVAIELVRRYGWENVFYFESNVEIDFYVPSANLAIQVSMQVLDNVDTKERETRAFVKLHNFIPDAKCLLITNSEETTLVCDGIHISVVPAWKWLLNTDND